MKQRLPLLLPLLLPLFLPAQPAWIRDSLDLAVKQAMKEEQVPGLALAVIKDGKVVLQRTYGLREANKPDPVDENTLFMIGSNSAPLPDDRQPRTRRFYINECQ
jgi:CubicO group peptidase (beta-lactamase class C family)